MKRITILVLFQLCGFSMQICNAQVTESDSPIQRASSEYPLEYSGVLKTNPLSTLWGSIPFTGEFTVVYEFVSAPQQASQIGLSYVSKSLILKALEDSIPDLKLLTANGVRLQLSHRFYIRSSHDYAPRGLYVAPHISYATVKVSTKHYSSKDVYFRAIHFNANFLIGWQWIYDSDYTLDVFGGLGYKENIWEEHDSQTTISLNTDDFGSWYSNSVKVTIGFHLGIAF